ncbi:NtaA/DmoA family FMN-dependent monooxygenase [Novosphingobium sp. BL-52-GroH]|uniref:NtaA/DmoA family FMN-dependent monooxygenase n=1 Tax=Novosphingobium sp. BL-52-GroH TaxID=3349877 RepID=UPI00384DDBA6
MFHLAWFTNPRAHGWTANGADRWAGNDILPERWQTLSFLKDMARQLEGACFDFIMIEDHVVLTNDKQNLEPRIDPMIVMPVLAEATRKLGIIGTFSSSFYPPFLLARQINSVDHISGGRAGWNVVTSSEDWAAQAFGKDKQPPHDERYAIADEMLDLVKQLWDAWDPNPWEMSAETGRYVDPTKFREFTFEGKYHKSLGPLNVTRSPQERPAICQAGSSPAGRDFAAKHADVILCSTFGQNSVQALKDFRDDVRARVARHGRDPDDVKVMYLISPVLGDTEEAAQQRYQEVVGMTPAILAQRLGRLTLHTDMDWTKFDLDAPFPDIDPAGVTQGFQGMIASLKAFSKGKTLRETLSEQETTSLKLIGTPEQVADQMQAAIEEIGGDGFLMHARPLTRRYLAEVLDGLVPILQRRGLVRGEYTTDTLRGHLKAF